MGIEEVEVIAIKFLVSSFKCTGTKDPTSELSNQLMQMIENYSSAAITNLTCNPARADREIALALAFPESFPAFPPA